MAGASRGEGDLRRVLVRHGFLNQKYQGDRVFGEFRFGLLERFGFGALQGVERGGLLAELQLAFSAQHQELVAVVGIGGGPVERENPLQFVQRRGILLGIHELLDVVRGGKSGAVGEERRLREAECRREEE